MVEPYIAVTKLDAARRQIDTAIELWFHDRDPVSIHTLLYAAADIIHGLFRRTGKTKLFFDNDVMQGRPDIAAKVREWPNFFKHGNRPHEMERVLDFNTEANLILFSANLAGLRDIDVELNDLEFAFSYYLLLHYPEYFTLHPGSEDRGNSPINKELRSYSKQEFLQWFLQALRERPDWKTIRR